MSPRNTWRWLLSAAVLSVLVIAQHRFFRKPQTGPSKILPGLQPAAVRSIEIARPFGQLEIRVERTNGGWALIKPFSYPAQGASIEALLASVERLLPVTSISAAELKDRPKADEE